ncbi:MAG: Carboxypeptidase regulatory-like domain [Algoriphagus marincola HL-49]|uniref:Carboxypeptidase regulatory-like domain n=1 Tax=Algoriphagus marincola HL-49 TaxID=1305737 RepID=A0A0P7Y897_9BACT|nr:MAG: Carboxypeptidase regulatory-like domain [Algoriphagus marincola HL-49]
MKKSFIIGCFSVLPAFFFSCGGNETPEPNPTQGSISGSVFLYDESSNRVSPEGMRIVLEQNSSTELSSLTNSEGKFSFENIPFGTVNLRFEKEEYGTFKINEISHQSLSTPITNIPSLGKKSTTQITELEVVTGNDSFTARVSTNPAGNSSNRRYIRFFFSTEDDISNENYQAFSPIFISQENPFERTFSRSELNEWGFTSEGDFYVRVYGESFWSNNYDDPSTGKTIFPNLNPTTVSAELVSGF